jgi:DNA-binding MarR family transcriptional regulator
MYLQENGPQKQSELISQFDVDGWAMSRLLGKLESRKHVVRRRDGTDKIVFLTTHSGTAKLTSSTDARIASEATT